MDTTNRIFRIICGVDLALKSIGRKESRTRVMWLSVNVRKPRPILELQPRFGVPAPFGDLQAAVIYPSP